ncbi:MAG: leucine-rich repeat domain-containing protein, partial [Lachnospiraceae bacterium]|nr:leucine-rich repeat domain-containing protein [Lachnospiraceae bacterium]
TYTSSDEGVVKVSKSSTGLSGCLDAVGPGEATITVTLKDNILTNGKTITDTIKVTVTGTGSGGGNGGEDPVIIPPKTEIYTQDMYYNSTTETSFVMENENFWKMVHAMSTVSLEDLQYTFSDDSVVKVTVTNPANDQFQLEFTALKPGNTDFVVKVLDSNTVTFHITVDPSAIPSQQPDPDPAQTDNGGNNAESSTTTNTAVNTTQQPSAGGNNAQTQTPQKKAAEEDEEFDPFVYGGLEYTIEGGYAEVSDCCTKKSKVTIPASVTYKGKKFSVRYIGVSAFNGCKKLKTVIIGKNVTWIGKKAFYNCPKLKSVQIKSKNIYYVGKSAFKKISGEAKIKVPKTKKKKYASLLKKKKDATTVIM